MNASDWLIWADGIAVGFIVFFTLAAPAIYREGRDEGRRARGIRR